MADQMATDLCSRCALTRASCRACAVWVATARQVLTGEFDEADGSTLASLAIGFGAVDDDVCKEAGKMVDKQLDKKGTK